MIQAICANPLFFEPRKCDGRRFSFPNSIFNLKERKRKTEKEILPPNPLLKEKENKEKEEKTTLSAGRDLSLPLSDLEKRSR